jgi:hypothetical protein
VVESVEAPIKANDNQFWLINNKDFYQGNVNENEHENEAGMIY